MSALRQAIVSDIENLPPPDFIAKHLFDRCPYVFKDDRDSFVSWKNKLSAGLEVDSASITIIGSSSLGISLNPHKSFKHFDQNSDVDVAVVSTFHFQSAWRYLRNNGKIRHKLNRKQRTSWEEHEKGKVFWGMIATDVLISLMPFGPAWVKALSDASQDPLIGGRLVNVRLYNDYESLRSYQTHGVQGLRQKILGGIE
ncbi:hypothetical protein [Bosea caraganae]|uniref:hypothetical protein n=1 Tax=Bosea caraganae TaxID=2763117 RepID=UPI0011C06D2C|nr:hypothetical protein [Bosea caraganae]